MAASKPALRAVGSDEVPERSGDLGWSLSDAILNGDRLQIEYAQRRDIASKLGAASGPAAAALHRQLSLTSDKIEALQAKADQEESSDAANVDDEAFDATAI